MSEEEKRAIELLKQEPDYSLSYYKREKAIDIVLNLVEKQQKEIEQFYKEININTEIHKRDIRIKDLEETINCLHETDKEYISKDKIREKIKEVENLGLQENIEACVCNKLAQLL